HTPQIPKLKTSRRLMSPRNATPQPPVRWSTFATTCLVSRHLGKVTVERRRVPDAVMYEANGLETLFFSGYDPHFEGDEPTVSRVISLLPANRLFRFPMFSPLLNLATYRY